MELIIKILIFFIDIVKAFAISVEPIAKATNAVFDKVLPYFGLLLLICAPIYYFVRNVIQHRKKIREDASYDRGIGWIIFLQALFLFEELVVLILFWKFPAWLVKKTGWAFWIPWLRWAEFIVVFIGSIWVLSRQFGERRGLYSAIGHVAVIMAGWFLGRWVGILFFSLPFILAYYLALYQIAIILIPTNTPKERSKDWAEKWRQFIILTFYTWGLQFPMFVVTHAWEKSATRINGSFVMDYPTSGIIWTKSHQVAAVTGGNQFKRVDDPGVIFTRKFERPFQIIDLRTQLRSSVIDVVSQEGITYKAIVSTAFRIDPETWDDDTYRKLRSMNPLLRGAAKPSYTRGSFHFSQLRIRATMGITSTQAADVNAINYWDQWALNIVEEAARKVLSQRTLDQLWRPSDDRKGKNALEGISEAFKEIAEPVLRAAGILLVGSRLVDFQFPANGKEKQTDIPKQQIASWKAEWERKRQAILDHATAESDRNQEEARAYAESVLLNSIAEGLEKTQQIDPGLPKYVIAMRFLSSLQDFINKVPQGEGKEELKTNLPEKLAKLLSEDNTGRPQ
jgi:regulator of protease activity HflC (stomatin/prohibitin superfamily)